MLLYNILQYITTWIVMWMRY